MSDRIPETWSEIRIVTDPAALEGALREWARARVIGVDTESNSFYAYHDRLCLFQVSTPDDDYIVDPIALGEEMRAVNDILADEEVVKVFHSAEFDLMLLKKDLGAQVRGLFDTQVAMTLLRHDKTGLAALIQSIYGIELSKKEQRSNWGRRPLSESQIAYARVDTHFLPDLYDRLKPELEEAGLTAAAHGEFHRLEREILPERQPDMEAWKKIKGVRQLGPAGVARLRALFHWREQLGQKKDVPVFRVLGNAALLEVATQPPKDLHGLAQLRGVGWRKARQIGNAVFEALKAAEGVTVELEPRKRLSKDELRQRRRRQENLEALRQWRKRTAQELGLPSERLMHRRHLEEIGRKLPRTREELLEVVPLNDWQRENLEHSLLEVLDGLPDPEQET